MIHSLCFSAKPPDSLKASKTCMLPPAACQRQRGSRAQWAKLAGSAPKARHKAVSQTQKQFLWLLFHISNIMSCSFTCWTCRQKERPTPSPTPGFTVLRLSGDSFQTARGWRGGKGQTGKRAQDVLVFREISHLLLNPHSLLVLPACTSISWYSSLHTHPTSAAT